MLAMNFFDDGDDDQDQTNQADVPAADPGEETYKDPLIGEGESVENSQL